jgi:hypothetical protein
MKTAVAFCGENSRLAGAHGSRAISVLGWRTQDLPIGPGSGDHFRVVWPGTAVVALAPPVDLVQATSASAGSFRARAAVHWFRNSVRVTPSKRPRVAANRHSISS